MNKKALDLLYRSFDSDLTTGERQELENALTESQALQEEKRRILEIREVIRDNAERSFQPFFSARVLNRIKSEKGSRPDFFASLSWSFRTVAVVAGIIIVVLFAHNSFIRNSVSIDSLLGMPKLQLEDTWQVDIIPAEDI